MGEILLNLGNGFVNAVQPLNFLMIVVGLTIGIVSGALPGITMLNSIVLVSVSVLGQSSMAAALVSLFAGMFLGTIGTEAQYGVERFTFGIPFLKTGVDFVTVLIGLFAIGEVLDQIVSGSSEPAAVTPGARAVPRLPLLALWPLRGPLARGTPVGTAVRGLAGAGATVSSFVSYGLEKQLSRTPELFGTGHAGGLVASESSVNGSTGGAMIHLLTLGIPGSAATAVMMGAFLLHGIQPGPLLFTRQTAEVYTIVAGMILANVVVIVLWPVVKRLGQRSRPMRAR